MKQLILCIILMLGVNMLFGQPMGQDTIIDNGVIVAIGEIEKDTIIGEKVCYVVLADHWLMYIWNIRTSSEAKERIGNDIWELEMRFQIADIFRKHLTSEELMFLKDYPNDVSIYWAWRLDSVRNKISQVKFYFDNNCREFWERLLPNRLYAIERDIIDNVRVPEDMPEKYKDYEFVGTMSGNKLFDEELANESRDNLQIFKHNPKAYWKKKYLKGIEKEERKEQVRRLRFFQANQWIVDSLDINLDSLKSTLGIMDLDSLEL